MDQCATEFAEAVEAAWVQLEDLQPEQQGAALVVLSGVDDVDVTEDMGAMLRALGRLIGEARDIRIIVEPDAPPGPLSLLRGDLPLATSWTRLRGSGEVVRDRPARHELDPPSRVR